MVLVRAVAIALISLSVSASARVRSHRPAFEPTDTLLEPPLQVEMNMQFGYIEGPTAPRLMLPDFEVDVGLTRRVELDIDGSVGIEAADGTTHFDHVFADNLWVAVKIDLFNTQRLDREGEFIGALQIGPRVTSGGGEALLLLGRLERDRRITLNLGGFADPYGIVDTRAAGLQAGLDLSFTVSKSITVHSQLSALYYLSSPDPTQFMISGEVVYTTPHIDLFVTVAGGMLRNTDRIGAFLGFTPRFSLARRRH